MSRIPDHILVIRLSALGDVAMLVPVIRQLTKNFPHLKITVLTRPFFSPLFNEFENVNVMAADVESVHKGLSGLWKLSREIKTQKLDAVADCHEVLRSRILKLFSGIKPWIYIDKGRNEKKLLISGKKFEPLKTTHQRYVEVFEKLGFNIDLSDPMFPPKPDLPKAHKSLETSKPLIGIAPFAAFPTKAYPLGLMKEVIEGLKGLGTVILFGGGSEEIRQMKELSALFDHVNSIAGSVSFADELKIIRNLDLMLSMDSGNAHLAAAYGVETITLWGVTHPFAGFAPFNQEPGNALLADRIAFPEIPTSIYGNKAPAGYEVAIASITSREIIDKIKEKLIQA